MQRWIQRYALVLCVYNAFPSTEMEDSFDCLVGAMASGALTRCQQAMFTASNELPAQRFLSPQEQEMHACQCVVLSPTTLL